MARRGDLIDGSAPTGSLAAVPPAQTKTAKQRQAGRREAVQRKVRSTKSSAIMATERAWADARDDNVLTAAGEIVQGGDTSSIGGTPNAVTRTWQHAAAGYQVSVPELGGAKLYVGNGMSRCKLVVGKRDAAGNTIQAFTGDEPSTDDRDSALPDDIYAEAAEIISTIRAPRGGQSELLRAHGEKTFIYGEEYLVPILGPAGMSYELLAIQELRKDGRNNWVRYPGPGFQPEPFPPGTQPIRIWRPDVTYSRQATSSVRHCLEILEELVVLTRLVRAAAISRMALSGLLLLPDEIDEPTDDSAPDGEQQNPFATEMIITAAEAIDDPAAAAAFVPYIIQAPKELLSEIRHIAFQGSDQEDVLKRTEGLERLGHGLDLPTEVVLSHLQTTFANAKQISQDTFSLYFEPSLELFCDALTETVLWPQMAKNRGIQPDTLFDETGKQLVAYPPEILQAGVTFDASQLISRPDRMEQVINLFIHDLTFTSVKVAEVREVCGLDPNNGPDDNEIAKRIDAYRLARIREVIPAPASDAAVPLADASAGKAVVPGASGGAKLAGTGGQAATQAVEDEALMASGLAVLMSGQVAGAADITVERAAERLGSRLRERLKGNSFTAAERTMLDGVANRDVARVLGATRVTRALGSESVEAVISADLSTFAGMVSRWAEAEGAPRPADVGAAMRQVVLGRVLEALA